MRASTSSGKIERNQARSLASKRIALEVIDADVLRVHFHRRPIGYIHKSRTTRRYVVEELDLAA